MESIMLTNSRFMEGVEKDAEPGRFQDVSADTRGNRLEPVETNSSRVSSSVQSIRRQSTTLSQSISRAATQRDELSGLERNATAMSRIQTQRTQHSHTIGATATSRKSKKPLPPMGGEKPYPPELPNREAYVVDFDGEHDPLHAQNWPIRKKLLVGAMLGYTTFVAAFGSSIFSAATRVVSGEFGVSSEVGILGVSLYVLGFATGESPGSSAFV